MSLSTFSKFFYDFIVNTENQFLAIDEGNGEVLLPIAIGSYTPTDLATELALKLNAELDNTYTVVFNRPLQSFTIVSDQAFDLLGVSASTGNLINPTIGFLVNQDYVGELSYTGGLAGKSYEPPFILQSYIPKENNEALISPTINKTSSGLVEVVRFGTERFISFSINYVTDNTNAQDGKLIKKQQDAVLKLNDFMSYIITKRPIEFMVDENNLNQFDKVLLESTEASGEGTSYELRELYDKGLPEFYDSGILKFRVLEV
jgi:hypothetical protein